MAQSASGVPNTAPGDKTTVVFDDGETHSLNDYIRALGGEVSMRLLFDSYTGISLSY